MSLPITFQQEGINLLWDDPTSAYPKPLFSILTLWLNKKAIEWIEKNAPQAWYKGMFAE